MSATRLDDQRIGADAAPLLQVRDLSIQFPTSLGWMTVVEGASFDVGRGETVGLVGESGSGKTVTALAMLGLTARTGGRVGGGSIRFVGEELVGASDREMRARRGRDLALVFQNATRSFNPAYTVGDQIAETVRRHSGLSRSSSRRRAVEMLERVRIPKAAERARDYPHQFSGGMLQRAMIAMSIACEPKLLIADEPTTALDVAVQASILELLSEVQRDTGLSILFVSHDLSVIAEICDRVVVMYAGEVVEQATADDLFLAPQHPYTAGLLAAIPRLGTGRRLRSIPGRVPLFNALPRGCRFHPRCPHAVPGRCDVAAPDLREIGPGTTVRCDRHGEISLAGIEVEPAAGVAASIGGAV